MAVFQLYVPRLYGWEQYFALMPPRIAVAMHAANVFVSLLVAWSGFLTLLAGARHRSLGRLGYPILYWLAIFWVVNVLYQIRVPAPFPGAIRSVVLGGAMAIALLYIFFVVTRYLGPGSTSTQGSERSPKIL